MTPPRRRAEAATFEQVRERVVAAASAASSKKAEDILVLDVSAITAITDFFVIADGANERQVRTIVEEVERQVAERFDVRPLRVEGVADARWVLVDYGDFFVHVFQQETRRFYDLERLWSDAPRLDWEESVVEAS